MAQTQVSPRGGAKHNKPKGWEGIFYIGGNGCQRHPDCFTCPLKDCEFDPSKEVCVAATKSARD